MRASGERQRRTDWRRALLLMVSGTAVGQAMAGVASPVISRLYTPEAFGEFMSALAVLIPIGAAAAGRFDSAIQVAPTASEVRALFRLGLLSSLITVALLGCGLAIALSLGLAVPGWMWMGTVVVGSMGVSYVLNQLAINEQRFGAVARRAGAVPSVTVVVQVLGGVLRLGVSGLMVGYAIGHAAGALLARGRRDLRRSPDGPNASLARVLARYRRFPLLLAPAAAINAASLQLPVLLLGLSYGMEVAGWYGMTQRVLLLPVSLLGVAVGQVYLREVSILVRQRSPEARALYLAASRRLLGLALPIGMALVLAGPYLFRLILGDRWSVSGEYSQLLALALCAQLIVSPISGTLIALGGAWAPFALDVLRLSLSVAAVVVPSLLGWTAISAVAALSAVSVLIYLATWLISLRALTAHQGGPLAA